MLNLSKRLKTAAGLSALVLATFAAANASAAPVFQVKPNYDGGVLTNNGAAFDASAINGFSSNRITQVSGNIYRSDGYVLFNGFSLNSLPVSTGTTRVNLDYGLYATFTQTFVCSGPLSPGVNCSMSALKLRLFADKDNDNTYNVAQMGSDATVTTAGDQTLLAYSDDVTSGVGGLNSLGGAFQNLNMPFHLTADGEGYFSNPVPFYKAAFSAFNNTSQGITCDTAGCVNAKEIVITSESGILDFNKVPEPGGLALVGVGLLAAGMIRRRQRA